MNLTGKKIGIWGLGVLGKSACSYFANRGVSVEVLDARDLSSQETALLASHAIPFSRQQDSLTDFLERNDLIIPSSGIDLRPYAQYKHKWLPELDFFYDQFKKPIIAVTGTIGKTSSTHMLGQILTAYDAHVAVGGNIGVGLFDILTAESTSMAIIEASSFQLELATAFTPDIALWTNLYPNHLNRHGSQEAYAAAKYAIMAHQQSHQHAIVPFSLRDYVRAQHGAGMRIFFTSKPVSPDECATLLPAESLLFIHNSIVMRHHAGIRTELCVVDALPAVSFVDNWLMIIATLHILGIPLTILTNTSISITVPEHRLELVTTWRDITFYNDSKSTTAQATLAALEQLKRTQVHLFLGGVSKGVDRTPLIKELAGKVKQLYCFGVEAEQLHAVCRQYGLPSSCHQSLEQAFELCYKQLQKHDTVLFSPAGASFDLFTNYMHRGNRFKELVLGLDKL